MTRSILTPAPQPVTTPIWAATLLVCALILCTVAFINGGPIIYPDSGLYIADGDRVLHLKAPLAVRPVFYGVAIWFLHWHRTIWAVLIAQGLIVSHAIWLTYRVVGARLRPLSFIGLILGLALLTPLSWHTSHVLPDVFTALLVLTAFLLGFCRDRLGRGEVVYLFLLATASTCFHLGNLVISFGLFVAVLLLWLGWRPVRRLARPSLVGGPVALALLAFFTFSWVLYQRLTLAPNSPPHLLARLYVDGPGRDFLRETCPTSSFAICKHVDEIPNNYEDFLWKFMNTVGYEDGKRIRAEEGAVLLGIMQARPLAVAGHMLANTAMQLVKIDSRTDFKPDLWAKHRGGDDVLFRSVRDSLQSRGLLDRPALDRINNLHAAVALLSFLACVGLLRSCLAARLSWPAGLIAWVFVGLLANAAASGALSGVFGRYGGRVIWLLPVAAVAAWVAIARSRPRVAAHAARLPERV